MWVGGLIVGKENQGFSDHKNKLTSVVRVFEFFIGTIFQNKVKVFFKMFEIFQSEFWCGYAAVYFLIRIPVRCLKNYAVIFSIGKY